MKLKHSAVGDTPAVAAREGVRGEVPEAAQEGVPAAVPGVAGAVPGARVVRAAAIGSGSACVIVARVDRVAVRAVDPVEAQVVGPAVAAATAADMRPADTLILPTTSAAATTKAGLRPRPRPTEIRPMDHPPTEFRSRGRMFLKVCRNPFPRHPLCHRLLRA